MPYRWIPKQNTSILTERRQSCTHITGGKPEHIQIDTAILHRQATGSPNQEDGLLQLTIAPMGLGVLFPSTCSPRSVYRKMLKTESGTFRHVQHILLQWSCGVSPDFLNVKINHNLGKCPEKPHLRMFVGCPEIAFYLLYL